MESPFSPSDNEQAYRDKLRGSMRGAIDFARRRQQKRQQAGKEPADITLTLSEAMALLQQQDYRCALTRLAFYSLSGGSYGPSRPSLDRIRHAGPYSLDNVRVVLLGVNSLRGAGSDSDMYVIAQALARKGSKPSADTPASLQGRTLRRCRAACF